VVNATRTKQLTNFRVSGKVQRDSHPLPSARGLEADHHRDPDLACRAKIHHPGDC
jgi:hypothetical protein